MFKSNRIFTIVARGGKVARVSYDPHNVRTTKKEFASDVPDMTSNAACLSMLNYTLNQLIGKGEAGRYTFVINDDVAIRAYEYRKAIRDGVDTDTLVKDWMEPEYAEAVQEFVELMSSVGEDMSLNFVKLFNVNYWDIEVAEGIELNDGDMLTFKDGEALDGKVIAQTNKLSGKFEVLAYRHNNVEKLVLKRPGNSADMIGLRNAVDYAFSKCPKEIADFSEGVAVGDDF